MKRQAAADYLRECEKIGILKIHKLDGVTKSQKEQIGKDITNSLVKTLCKKPEHIHIVIDDVETDNWGFCRHVDYGVSQEVQIVPAP